MKETMKQQVMTAPGVIEFRQVPTPTPGPGQVLVKIHRIGVCGSVILCITANTRLLLTRLPRDTKCPAVSKHWEKESRAFSVGQKVTIEPQVTCGTCYPCTHGQI